MEGRQMLQHAVSIIDIPEGASTSNVPLTTLYWNSDSCSSKAYIITRISVGSSGQGKESEQL
jgi:hypothetical protein